MLLVNDARYTEDEEGLLTTSEMKEISVSYGQSNVMFGNTQKTVNYNPVMQNPGLGRIDAFILHYFSKSVSVHQIV